MKKIALISTFCDNEKKMDLLKKNLQQIKTLSIDTMIFTPFNLSTDVLELCDYVIISKENPVLNWPEKAYFQWWDGTISGKKVSMSTTYPDYGYAGLVQFKRMADLALSMKYDLYFPMIYDINIDNHVESVFLGNKKNSFFPSMRDGQVWGIGLHLISLDEEHLIRFKNLITKESYLIEEDFDAFAWLHRAVKLIPGVLEKTPVEDLIYFLENKNFFDLSLSRKYKCFIHKTNYDNMKLIFYDYGGIKKFKITCDNFEKEYDVREWEQIELPFNSTQKLLISHEENEIDYIHIIKNIGQNIFEIENS